MQTRIPFFEYFNQRLPLGYALIRIFVGGALFTRGLLLMLNPEAVIELAQHSDYYMWHAYIAIGHLVGGLMLCLGLGARLGALFQIPILAGAVFVVHLREGLLGPTQSFELAALMLVLLLIFFFFGAGPWSFDARLAHRGSGQVEPQNT